MGRADDARSGSRVRTNDDLLALLDALLAPREGAWWNEFFADRTKDVPFFVEWPDETLVADFERGVLRPGRVLELGCGNGRNAVYLASRSCSVDAVDFSQTAIRWARERARAARQEITFIEGSVFDFDVALETYDIVYDSGCFHHLPPHRRAAYVALVSGALKPGGVLSLVCFSPEGGSGLNDLEVYERRTLGGGLGFSEDDLRHIFEADFQVTSYRPMEEMSASAERYGKSFLVAARMVRGARHDRSVP